MGVALSFSASLESTTCPACGIAFAVPTHYIATIRKNAGEMKCPNGHTCVWTESEADRLKKQLAEKERDLAFQRSQREAAERREQAQIDRALKAEKKLKRAKNGVCPCCKRSFTALRRHIETKHPEWKP